MRAEDKRCQGQVPSATPEGRSGWARFTLQHLGVVWIMSGIIMYALLSLVARSTLHSEWAMRKWRAEVPLVVYDRSMVMFATAFVIDILNACFELKTSRLDMVLLPAFVKGMATVTNTLVRCGYATIGAGASGNVVMVQRYICWMHTTPTILLLVKMMSTTITRKQVGHAIACVELMLLTGVAGSLASGWMAGILGVLSHLFFLPLIPYLHQGLTEVSSVLSNAVGPTMVLVRYMTLMMWATFGLIWDLRMFGLVGLELEEVVYLCCDFSVKVIFSCGLMLSSFKGMDSRRVGVMRQIQDSHRQTFIQELKLVIEQKDAFMSSVSHELRTPLNGIIGISEGLLSGCCGILNKSVRRQIYIVRTSGARLLALINDVMDAAALRQHRLVLKQERLELRQVVGDVSDLTRSLVDNDVTLRNDVPEGMCVWADSGRIIQVLNNLLGNAAKFTHQGIIRVSATWHDQQHQWLAVHVTDTGVGIPKHKQASVFLPFEQVDGSISRQYGGFGLGLSITQELVKAHGGELWVRSKEGKGSCFTFTLPSFTGQSKTAQQQPRIQATASITPGTSLERVSSGVLSSSALASLSRRGSRTALVDLPGGSKSRRSSALVTSAVLAGDVSNNSSGLLQLDTNSSMQAEFADSCVGDEYAKELPYDAAQLSALASSKPFAAKSDSCNQQLSSSRRPNSRVASGPAGSIASNTAAEEANMAAVRLDPRPTQFARTGRYQILSVDDDNMNQTVVQSLLGSTGYEVVTLMSGIRTLEYIDNCEVLPDLILLDVMIPDMSGPEVCAQLAKRDPHLGIPIILVSAHSEEAMVVRGLDSGAVDYITKPFKRAEFLARIRAKLTLPSGAPAQEQVYDEHDAAEPLVMCIDDDEVNHIVLEGMLQSANYRYLKARSGAEALRMLEEAGSRPPHLVLLDAALPDTTGFDVLQQIREQFSQVALPVIMLTARHNQKAIVEALDSGANDYAVKPFRRSELLARIRMHIRNSQKASAALVATPVSPIAATLAAADLSVELQQLPSAAEQLKQVPLLVAQLDQLDVAAAGLAPEQLSQLFGTIADLFDAVVEKYAVLKVEASDSLLMVAAPISSSAANSARNSLQLPTVSLPQNNPTDSSSIAAGQSAAAAPQQQQQHPSQGVMETQPAFAAGVTLQRLLQLAQELTTSLGTSHAAADCSCDAPQQTEQATLPASIAAADGAAAGLALPACCLGTLQLRVAVHIGELHAGVVGSRRPRYRLLGPALQYVKQACAAAPPNRVVATDAAAAKLMALGVQGLEPVTVPWPEPGHIHGSAHGSAANATSGGSNSMQQLWLVSAEAAASVALPSSCAGSSSDPVHLLLKSAEKTLAATNCNTSSASVDTQQQQQLVQSSRSPVAGTQLDAKQQQKVELQKIPALLVQQQQPGNALQLSQVAGWPAAAQHLLVQQQLSAQQQLLPSVMKTDSTLQPYAGASGHASQLHGGWTAEYVSTPTAQLASGAVALAVASSLSSGSSSSAPTHSASSVSSCDKAAVGPISARHSVDCMPGVSELAAQQCPSSNRFGLLLDLQQYAGLLDAGSVAAQSAATPAAAHTTPGMPLGLLGSMPPGGTAPAASSLGAALAALAGWQLGSDEAQQMMQLKQELDDLQQQVATMVGNSVSWSCAAAAASIAAAAQSAFSIPTTDAAGMAQNYDAHCIKGMLHEAVPNGSAVTQVERQPRPLQRQQQRRSSDDSADSSGGRSSNAVCAQCAGTAGTECSPGSINGSDVGGASKVGGSSRTLSPTLTSSGGSKFGQLFRRRCRNSKG